MGWSIFSRAVLVVDAVLLAAFFADVFSGGMIEAHQAEPYPADTVLFMALYMMANLVVAGRAAFLEAPNA